MRRIKCCPNKCRPSIVLHIIRRSHVCTQMPCRSLKFVAEDVPKATIMEHHPIDKIGTVIHMRSPLYHLFKTATCPGYFFRCVFHSRWQLVDRKGSRKRFLPPLFAVLSSHSEAKIWVSIKFLGEEAQDRKLNQQEQDFDNKDCTQSGWDTTTTATFHLGVKLVMNTCSRCT